MTVSVPVSRASGVAAAPAWQVAARILRDSFTFILLVAFLAIAGVLSPSFLSVTNLVAVAYGAAVIGIVALGQTVLLLTGNFDLSVAGVVSVAGIVTLLVMPISLPLAIAAGLLVGLIVGLVNGLIVIKTGASPFLVTLGVQTLLYGGGLLITQSRTLYGVDESYRWLGQGRIASVPVALLLFLGLAVALQVVLLRTNFGRHVYAIGHSREAARLSGIPVNVVLLSAFALSGLLAALAGLVLSSRLNSITADAGLGYEFFSISAAVVGGVSLFGGRGSTLRTVVGVFVIGALNNVLILLGINFASSAMVRGAVFLLVVGIDGLARRGTD